MPRITTTVDDGQLEHVKRRSEEIGVSNAEIVRRLIDADADSDVLRSESPRSPEHRIDVMQLRDRVDELEERLESLETDDRQSGTPDSAPEPRGRPSKT